MSTIVAELYDALKTAGVPDDQAKAAAGAIVGRSTQSGLATKSDLSQLESLLKADMSELEARLIKWNVGMIINMTSVFAGILKLL
jgi:hypothetical protein